MFEKLDAELKKYVEAGIPGNDVIVYHNGREVHRFMYGFSDAENKIPINGKEKYNIYSCTKPITCTAAMQLVEKGKIKLDDRLCDYIPSFGHMSVIAENGLTEAKNKIMLKHLFTMTAGLSYDASSPQLREAREKTGGKCPTVETVNYIAKMPLLFEPGERWEYGFCHDVLAAVIEIVSGKKFGTYVRENIFEPLGMENSTLLLPDSDIDSLAEQYIFRDGVRINCGKNIQNLKLGSEYESGGAGCISTVEDYIKFLEALREGDVILSSESIEKMSENVLAPCQKSAYWFNDYGYGLGVRCPDGKNDRSDFGWDGMAGSYLAVDRKNKITIFYAQHAICSPVQKIRSNTYMITRKEIAGY